MKFLLDANIPHSAKSVFPEEDEVFHVRDFNLGRATDEEIINWAVKNQAALITRDLDFGNILNFPPQKYLGIIILRLPYFYSAKKINEVIGKFIRVVDKSFIPQATIIVEENRFRLRKFNDLDT